MSQLGESEGGAAVSGITRRQFSTGVAASAAVGVFGSLVAREQSFMSVSLFRIGAGSWLGSMTLNITFLGR